MVRFGLVVLFFNVINFSAFSYGYSFEKSNTFGSNLSVKPIVFHQPDMPFYEDRFMSRLSKALPLRSFGKFVYKFFK